MIHSEGAHALLRATFTSESWTPTFKLTVSALDVPDDPDARPDWSAQWVPGMQVLPGVPDPSLLGTRPPHAAGIFGFGVPLVNEGGGGDDWQRFQVIGFQRQPITFVVEKVADGVEVTTSEEIFANTRGWNTSGGYRADDPFSVDHGYPYSTPTDPPDVPGINPGDLRGDWIEAEWWRACAWPVSTVHVLAEDGVNSRLMFSAKMKEPIRLVPGADIRARYKGRFRVTPDQYPQFGVSLDFMKLLADRLFTELPPIVTGWSVGLATTACASLNPQSTMAHIDELVAPGYARRTPGDWTADYLWEPKPGDPGVQWAMGAIASSPLVPWTNTHAEDDWPAARLLFVTVWVRPYGEEDSVEMLAWWRAIDPPIELPAQDEFGPLGDVVTFALRGVPL